MFLKAACFDRIKHQAPLGKTDRPVLPVILCSVSWCLISAFSAP